MEKTKICSKCKSISSGDFIECPYCGEILIEVSDD